MPTMYTVDYLMVNVRIPYQFYWVVTDTGNPLDPLEVLGDAES